MYLTQENMLRVSYKDKKGRETFEDRFVGEGKKLDVREDEIIALSATDNELDAIKEQLQNLPMSGREVVVWHGDMAKFISQNLDF